MNWYEAMVLGLVEGLTEYLPVSSTGHLILTQRALGIAQSEAADAYAICIQAGAIVAVLGLYWQRVVQMARGALRRDAEGRTLLVNIVAAFVPAAVIGLLFEERIDSLLGSLWYTVAAWLVGGVAILLVSWRRRNGAGQTPGKELHQLTWRFALIIGFAQCIAMWPGVSRSLVTIVGGVLIGLRLTAAVEFSFLLGVVTLGAASAYKGMKHFDVLMDNGGQGPIPLLIGFFFAFISAAIAIKWMVAYLKKHNLAIFGWYRVAVAAIVAMLIVAKVLHA